MRIAGRKHDLVALRVFDERETELPNIGLIKVYNKESGRSMWVDSSDRVVRNNYREWWDKHDKYLISIFKRSGVDMASIRTDQDYVRPLMNLFQMRESRF